MAASVSVCSFFFFQAEDGIRDDLVTGVQTCALPILSSYTKLYVDHRRTIRIATEIQTDLGNHDLYSRQAARLAIEKYNRHIEQCNRAIENAESGQDRPGWGDSPVEGLPTELRRVVAQLDATTQDRHN